MSSSLFQCYNKGCGQKFDPLKNSNDSCVYHPGPPYFHDAYKIWKCCDKKSTDFSTWLSYRGCSKGFHNKEKPPDVPKQVTKTEIRTENPEKMIVWDGLNKPAERISKSLQHEVIKLKVEVNEAALNVINRYNDLNSNIKENNSEKILIGAPCKNSTCKEVFRGNDADLSICYYHSGTAVFHEGMKYWSCCQKKTSNFSSFLDQVGCKSGNHCWSKLEQESKLREDWFSRNGYIHINLYCKGALPNRSSFESNGLILSAVLVHGFGDKESLLNYELWGRISPIDSWVVFGERKVELILKQVGADGWPKLLYEQKEDDKIINTKS